MELNMVTERIIGSAISVHRALGPGLLESVYEAALEIEIGANGLMVERQKILPVHYREQEIGQHRLDLLVEEKVVIELKSVERMDPMFDAQILGYLRLGGYPLGLLINFNSRLLKSGVKRFKL